MESFNIFSLLTTTTIILLISTEAADLCSQCYCRGRVAVCEGSFRGAEVIDGMDFFSSGIVQIDITNTTGFQVDFLDCDRLLEDGISAELIVGKADCRRFSVFYENCTSVNVSDYFNINFDRNRRTNRNIGNFNVKFLVGVEGRIVVIRKASLNLYQLFRVG